MSELDRVQEKDTESKGKTEIERQRDREPGSQRAREPESQRARYQGAREIA